MTREERTEAQAAADIAPSPIPGISRPVFLLSIVSFLTDISSEMTYPLIPLFLTSVLGAPLVAVGLIEGVAESSASVIKTASGWLSDRWRVRKPLVVLGYGLSTIAKPLMAAAHVWPAALGVRFLDRAGKGVRTAPRDALLADVTDKKNRGLAFGFHRAADTMGAVLGPGIGLGLLAALDEDFRLVFLLAAIPAAAGVLFLALVRERKPPPAAAHEEAVPLRQLGVTFYLFLGVSLVFALGNSSDVFLILRAKDLGLSNTGAVSAYIVFNAAYAALSVPAGIASDRLGRRNVIAVGFLVFAGVYVGFGFASASAAVWPLFALYGLHMALTEGVGRALIADSVPARSRGTALGLYTGAMGAMILVASVLAGVLWDEIGPSAPFFLGGATAAASLILLLALLPRSRQRRDYNDAG